MFLTNTKIKNYALRIAHYFRRNFQPHRAVVPVDVLTGYAHWAKSYPPEAHNPLMQLEEQAMLSLLPHNLTGQICLDLACGSGRYMRHLQVRQAKQIIGVDYSPHMLAEAGFQLTMSNEQLANTTIHHSPFARSPFFPLPFASHTFDLVTCGLAVGHEQNLMAVLAEIARVLRPGGVLLYSDFHPLGTLAGWERSFTAADGTQFNLEHYLHLYSHHQQACHLAELTIDSVREPLLGDTVPAYQNFPAALVIRAKKPYTT